MRDGLGVDARETLGSRRSVRIATFIVRSSLAAHFSGRKACYAVREEHHANAKIRDVIEMTGLSRMTVYRFEKAGTFPKRRRVVRIPAIVNSHSTRW